MTSYNVKLCLLGNSAVGKSCIALRYVENDFKNVAGTVGAAYISKRVATTKGTVFKLNIWDTSGVER